MAGISSKENQPEAERFGVKELLPAYLSPNLQLQEFLTGVSVASCGSGYDPLTAKLMSVLSMSDQLEMFKSYIRKIKAAVGENKTEIILSISIFLELYGLGARRIGVMSLLCTSNWMCAITDSQRTLGGGIQRGCSEYANNASMLFNSKLSTQMYSLNQLLPDARIVPILIPTIQPLL
ncbi:unnamed protein product [Prunus armeniaca]|uniref:Uncharacterized protein n=1 Tax=Prunus armeniaca TaxID=36596 RepID=A0A6J5UME9_PRUAR|nr:unnamed protein product [Prunus armeniaca]